jgi:hypothetical protein
MMVALIKTKRGSIFYEINKVLKSQE